MKERLINALHGFGFVSDAERDRRIESADQIPVLPKLSSTSQLWPRRMRRMDE